MTERGWTAGPAGVPVRVVRIISRMNVGGPAIHVMNLTAGLAEPFPTVLVTGDVAPGEANLLQEAIARGLPIVHLPELGRAVRPWDDLVAFVKLLRLMRRLRPEVVHTHAAKAGALGRVAAWLAGVPIRVHTFHGHVFDGYFGPRATRVVLAIERLLARITTTVVALSPRQAEDLASRYRICRRERIRVVPLGFDFARFDGVNEQRLRTQFRRELGIPPRHRVVSIVGRLAPIKNHALFLRAAVRVRARTTFVLVGGGDQEPVLRELVRELGIEDRVRFAGWRSDLERVYAGSDVVALTSDNEGTPVCVIEALAAGRPVVATAVGGVPDVLEDGYLGVLVERGDEAAFAAALDRLLADPALCAELAERGRTAARRRFGVRRLNEDVERLYRDLLGHPLPVIWPVRPRRPAVDGAALPAEPSRS